MLYRRKIPLIIVYEGWDAAGKGGNIKRLAAALDPRGADCLLYTSLAANETFPLDEDSFHRALGWLEEQFQTLHGGGAA